MNIKIDTSAVRTTANQIANINSKISSDFSTVDTAINELNRAWDGVASEVAITKFQNIKTLYYNNRYQVVNDMVNYMNRQISEGYEGVEAAIQSAASAFR